MQLPSLANRLGFIWRLNGLSPVCWSVAPCERVLLLDGLSSQAVSWRLCLVRGRCPVESLTTFLDTVPYSVNW
eukprot:8412768-Karenia_brevis.AAC.1